MDLFLKASAMTIVCVIIYLVLNKESRDIATMLTITGCCFLGVAAFQYLDTVMDFIHRLTGLSQLDKSTVQILLKATGISIMSEFCAMICNDAGNSALGKGIQLLSAATVLWLSLPLLTNLVELVQSILTNV